jgi:hypothetical protein
MTGLARAQIRAISRRAIYVEAGEAVAIAFRELLVRLQSECRELGEPMYYLRKMRMEVRNATVPPLYIEYGVHDLRPLVVIRHVASLSELPDE